MLSVQNAVSLVLKHVPWTHPWQKTSSRILSVGCVTILITRGCAAFVGSIPKALGGLSELKELYLAINKLTGEVKGAVGAYLPPVSRQRSASGIMV